MKNLLATLISLFVITTSSFALSTNDSVSIKYAQSIHNKTVIQITVFNDYSEDLEILLHGDDGTFLYSESFSTTKYSKKFLLNIAEESDLENINITIIYKAKRITSYYVIPIINHSICDL